MFNDKIWVIHKFYPYLLPHIAIDKVSTFRIVYWGRGLIGSQCANKTNRNWLLLVIQSHTQIVTHTLVHLSIEQP